MIILTGKQNSSKAGLTNVVYWVRICSRSRPLFMSRRTTGELGQTTDAHWQLEYWMFEWERLRQQYLYETVWHLNLCPQRASCGTCHELSEGKTPGSPQKGPHLQGKPRSCLPACKHSNLNRDIHTCVWKISLKTSSCYKECKNPSPLPGMSDKVICWHFHHLTLDNVLQCFVHQFIIKCLWKTKRNVIW